MGRFVNGGARKREEAHSTGYAAGYERATHGGDVNIVDVPWRYAKPKPDRVTGRVKGSGTPETERAYLRGFESGVRQHNINARKVR